MITKKNILQAVLIGLGTVIVPALLQKTTKQTPLMGLLSRLIIGNRGGPYR